MEMTEGSYRQLDPGGVYTPSMDKHEETDTGEFPCKTSNSRENLEVQSLQPSGPWKKTAVCLGLLCALLLSAIVLLSFKMMENKQLPSSYKEKLQMHSGYDNMTIEHQQLQITHNNLKAEKSQLQTSYSNLSREKLQLQGSYDHLNREKSGLQTSNDHCTTEKSSLQNSYNSLLREKSQLQTGYNNLTEENSQFQTSYNNLTKEKSQLQTNYNNLNREKSQLQTSYNNLNREKSQFETSNGNLNKEKSQLQTSYNNLNKEKSQLQTSYNNLNREKSQLQSSYSNLNKEKSQLQDKFHTMAAEKDKLQKRLCNLRMDITKYAVDVTLDPDTAHNYLILSADEKQVRDGGSPQNLPDNPKRFSPVVNALGKQGFTSGRFYYEVEVSGKTAWTLGIARESIKRKVNILRNPESGYWTIWLRDGNQYKALADPYVLLSLKEKPERVGVFVDYGAGLVSFYDADRWNLLYSFWGVSFKEKIYPYFSPYLNDDGKNSSPLIIVTPILCTK